MNRPLTPHQHQAFLKSQILSAYNSPSTLVKGNLADALEKVGEGSKGGKVIGHTKSGKAVYENSTSNLHKEHTKTFTKEDHLDAAGIHRNLMAESLGVLGKTKSDKTVYDKFEHPGHKDFTAEDHADASYMHMNAVSKNDTNHTPTYHDEQSTSHYRALRKINESERMGETASGKKIHPSFDAPEHKDFTAQDHLDAVNAHTKEYGYEKNLIEVKHGENKKAVVAEMNKNSKIARHGDERQKHLNAYGKLVNAKKD